MFRRDVRSAAANREHCRRVFSMPVVVGCFVTNSSLVT